MKVPAAPSPHEKLHQVPPTSASQRNLHAPADAGTTGRRIMMLQVATKTLLHACVNNFDAGHPGHGRPGHRSPGQDCSGGGLHHRTGRQGHPDCCYRSEAPAPAGEVVVSSLPGRPAAAAGMLPWARGFAILYTTPVVACMPIISLGGLFLAALRDSQNL
jgi:hypothetical protein